MTATPAERPGRNVFSSGPCAKPPTWQAELLSGALLGRSHRSKPGKARLGRLIGLIREILEVPDSHRIGIVPASDTGAVEMALWSLLGERSVEVLAWESFGRDWLADVTRQLRLDAVVHTAEYGELPDLSQVDFSNDVVFTWNGTTSGVRVPDGHFIPEFREGLTICDATSAAFAVDLPWNRLDATTFSWQKILGGEAAHGIIILSPRAVTRLESWIPQWPVPKIFRLAKDGKLNEGIFRGVTINTPSMLCVEDCLLSLNWAKSVGGLRGMIARADANAQIVAEFVNARDWIAFLASDERTRSNTSVCLVFDVPGICNDDMPAFAKSVAGRLAAENVAHDIESYRDAPPGLRIWCGSTVEASDLRALMPWIEWAYQEERAAYNACKSAK